MSPATTPVGLLTVTLAVVLIAVVEVPRCAICPKLLIERSKNMIGNSNNLARQPVILEAKLFKKIVNW